MPALFNCLAEQEIWVGVTFWLWINHFLPLLVTELSNISMYFNVDILWDFVAQWSKVVCVSKLKGHLVQIPQWFSDAVCCLISGLYPIKESFKVALTWEKAIASGSHSEGYAQSNVFWFGINMLPWWPFGLQTKEKISSVLLHLCDFFFVQKVPLDFNLTHIFFFIRCI